MTTTSVDSNNQPDDFTIAVDAVTRAIRAINADERPGDGAEFICHLVAAVAANLGSSYAVVQSRPGSWEADKVSDLLASTVGSDDEYLLTHRPGPIELVVNAENELVDLELFSTYEASRRHIGRCMFGDRHEPKIVQRPDGTTLAIGRGQLTKEELIQLEPVDDLLYDLEEADLAEYQARFAATVQAEWTRLQAEDPYRYPKGLSVVVRFTDDYTGLTDPYDHGLASQLYEHARLNTPLPGSNLRSTDLPTADPVQALLDAGHWPHLRIPELGHYGTPTPADEQEN